jgi:hypothetical protein
LVKRNKHKIITINKKKRIKQIKIRKVIIIIIIIIIIRDIKINNKNK